MPRKAVRVVPQEEVIGEEHGVDCSCGTCCAPSSKSRTVWGLIAALALVVCGVVVWGVATWGGTTGQYAAVYLQTGDLYFGELIRFPRLHLRNVWYFERVVDQATQQQQLRAVPFNALFWGPGRDVYLNDEQVVFMVPLKDSDFSRAIKDPESLRNQINNAGNAQQGIPQTQGLPSQEEPAPAGTSSQKQSE